MKIAVFGTQSFEEEFLQKANGAGGHDHDLVFLHPNLTSQTVSLAAGHDALCVFVNDDVHCGVIERLAEGGTKLVLLRCAGFNNVDVAAAHEHGLTALRVPAYSPYAVAEHTVALMLALNRRLHRAVARVREQNFSLQGLLGFDMHGKTAGIIGTGRIGIIVAKILAGFSCELLGHDPSPSAACRELGMTYVDLPELARRSNIVTLHCPLTPATHHLIDDAFLEQVKPGVMLINTNRGAVIDSRAVIGGLKTGRIGSLGIDVYEEEADLFFRDLSDVIIRDDVFARLMTFPNVIITAHQAFFTREALDNIAATTMQNATDFAAGTVNPENRVSPEHYRTG